MRRCAVILGILFCVASLAGAAPSKEEAAQKRWKKIMQSWEKVLRHAPSSPEVNYNVGVAQAHLGDNDKARQRLTQALVSRRSDLEAAANYNIGNTLFQSAKTQEAQNPQAAAENIKEALQYYRRALELKQNDRDAKYNYELSDKWLKVLLKRPPPPPQGGGGGSKNKEEKKEQDKDSESPQQTPQQPPDAQPRPSEDSRKSGSTQEKELTKEEAKMLIASFGQEGPREEMNTDKKSDAVVAKDW
jgi:Ca-activated chloride channel family protein